MNFPTTGMCPNENYDEFFFCFSLLNSFLLYFLLRSLNPFICFRVILKMKYACSFVLLLQNVVENTTTSKLKKNEGMNEEEEEEEAEKEKEKWRTKRKPSG